MRPTLRPPLRVATTAFAILSTIAVTGCSGSSPATGPSRSTPPSAASSTGTASPTGQQTLHVRRLHWQLASPVGREAIIATGSTLTIAGGLVGSDSSTAASWRLGITARTVEPMAPLAMPVHDTAGAIAQGAPLVIGGGNTVEQSVVQRWNGHRWRVVGHLPQARSDLVAATVDGHVIVLGGYNGTRPAEPDILSSTTGRTWRTIGQLALPVRYAAGVVADGAIWLFGGERNGSEQTAVQRLDPTTGRSRIVAHLPHGIGHSVAITLGDRILIAGGRTAPDAITAQMWWFTPASGRISPAGNLPAPLADSATAQVGDVTYIVGGENPRPTRQLLAVTYR